MELINKIKEYFVSMEMYDGKWVVAVKFKPKWGAYPSEDGRIKVSPDEQQPDLWWYYADDTSVDVDEIINLINETVVTNMEAIKKVELFKLKAGELKQIFSDEKLSFKKLQTLKFVFDDSVVERKVESEAPITKKKTTSKKDLMSQVGDVIQEHDVFTQPPIEKKVDEEVEEVEEVPVKKSRKTKQKTQEVVESLTANEMTSEEIDELRG